ncbi:LysR family transcriptional regulator [Burkholderia cenocepacia]|uniref:LysR family transcriptional regulator n=2 Tax=Burkholderia cenocepacia TaxID=95486 RepID=UPI001B9D52E3|nr:LysR family transcriptional regulator [Burkholderia cenocepacia]MBN3534291.1 LysR family transcriptional regulator [Burkholderia cenocepacia]MBR8174096.1 LysR family transcriptional regulator [Burkholderia cenocepacia]MBR8428787.1 LysR family transcriptional regulator [Burkholderia cenocepacia]MBU9660052.1 LysR family transcriptional regulator [Burkholderia cenocepacia]MCW3664002.1 LysR family transcriptional regulator [Burkholderia cenocepacia]
MTLAPRPGMVRPPGRRDASREGECPGSLIFCERNTIFMGTGGKNRSGQLVSMRAFIAVAETGSFSAAAKKLHVNGSTVSKQVSSLEARLSVKLLHRSTKHVRLTEAGDFYFTRVSKLIAELDRVSEETAAAAQSMGGRIRIGISSIVGGRVIGRLLDEFARAYPHIRSLVRISDQPFDLVRDGLSIAIVPAHWHTPDSFVRRRLYQYTRVVAESVAWCDAARDPGRVEAARFVVVGDGSPVDGAFDRLTGSPHHHLVETNDPDLQRKLIVHLKGIGLLPDYAIDRHDPRDDLRARSDMGGDRREICLVYPTRLYLPRSIRAFIDLALEFFANIHC